MNRKKSNIQREIDEYIGLNTLVTKEDKIKFLNWAEHRNYRKRRFHLIPTVLTALILFTLTTILYQLYVSNVWPFHEGSQNLTFPPIEEVFKDYPQLETLHSELIPLVEIELENDEKLYVNEISDAIVHYLYAMFKGNISLASKLYQDDYLMKESNLYKIYYEILKNYNIDSIELEKGYYPHIDGFYLSIHIVFINQDGTHIRNNVIDIIKDKDELLIDDPIEVIY